MFSILVVSLNPGGKLVETVRSVTGQNYKDYEVVVKDGGSGDGSLDQLRDFLRAEDCGERVRILVQPDSGIYDGMNQATRAARGGTRVLSPCNRGTVTCKLPDAPAVALSSPRSSVQAAVIVANNKLTI